MANEVQIKLNRSASIGGQFVGGTDESVYADFQAIFKQTIPAGTTNYEVDFPVTVANVAASILWASNDVDVYTNAASTGSPTQHIVLPKNVTLCYTNQQGSGQRTLTSNVTAFYITNSGGSDAVVVIAVGAKQAPTGTL